MKRAVSLLCSAAALALPCAARAEIPPALVGAIPGPVPERSSPPPRPSTGPEITLAAGVRGMILPSAGFQPYASGNDVLMQLSVSAGVTLFRVGSASMVASLEWNVGNRGDSARGQGASLTVHRLAGALETRWQPASRLYLFAKVAPGAFNLLGSIQSPNLDRPLVSRTWTWGLDTAFGAGLLIGSVGDSRAPAARFWLTGELGYTFAGTSSMTYAPPASDTDPRHFGSIMLPAFQPAGGVSRLAVAASF